MPDELICHRCGAMLRPGRGDFYVVRIEAFADPTGPEISPEQWRDDLPGKIEALVEELRDASERELVDQIHRRIALHLCRRCYVHWIENPTG